MVWQAVQPADPDLAESVHKKHTPDIKVDKVLHSVHTVGDVQVRQFAPQAGHKELCKKNP